MLPSKRRRDRPKYYKGASALTPAEEKVLRQFYLTLFEQGHPVRSWDLLCAAELIKSKRPPKQFDSTLHRKCINESWLFTYIKRTPDLSKSRNPTVLYQPHKIPCHVVDAFFRELYAAWGSLSEGDLFYLSWTSIPTCAPSLKPAPSDWVYVLDCYDAVGHPQPEPFFYQYKESHDHRVISLSPSHTRNDMLKIWFDRTFRDDSTKKMLLIDESKVVPSESFKMHCLSRNVTVVCIPAALSPHFDRLDFSMGNQLAQLIKSRASWRPDRIMEYMKKRKAIMKADAKKRWEDSCIVWGAAADEKSAEFYRNIPADENECISETDQESFEAAPGIPPRDSGSDSDSSISTHKRRFRPPPSADSDTESFVSSVNASPNMDSPSTELSALDGAEIPSADSNEAVSESQSDIGPETPQLRNQLQPSSPVPRNNSVISWIKGGLSFW